jgi:hypothetical protein
MNYKKALMKDMTREEFIASANKFGYKISYSSLDNSPYVLYDKIMIFIPDIIKFGKKYGNPIFLNYKYKSCIPIANTIGSFC